MKRIRTIAVFPALFTLGNLLCGFFGIVVAARVEKPTEYQTPAATDIRQWDITNENHNLMLSGWLILLAMVFDALDGHIARLTRSPTEFGAQLDSLADVVTFGVAPAFLLVKMCHSFAYLYREALLQPVWMIAATYAMCAALRLARFNAETDETDDHLHFSGLPSPAAGASIASFAVFFYTVRLETNEFRYAAQLDSIAQIALPFFALMVALLMVSRVPYPHVVNQVFQGHKSFAYLVGLVFALATVIAIKGYAVPLVCCGFVLGPAGLHLYQRIASRRAREEPLI